MPNSAMARAKISSWAWGVAITILAAKLALVSAIPVYIRFSPFDDTLYVSRAYAFLNGNAWGAYDAYTLAKLPGISLWLIVSRILGVPYLLGVNLLYGLAGMYLLRAAQKAGVGYGVTLLAYAVYLANPVTFSVGWALVMREALSSTLMVAMLGASLHILLHPGPRLPKAHLGFLTLLFSFTLLLREEDVLLWGYLVLLVLAVGWLGRRAGKRFNVRAAAVVLVVPALAAVVAQYGLRQYNEMHYGVPMLTDYGEGELPKLVASIRSVSSAADNRMVMIPKDVLAKLRPLLPEFAPVIDALPPPGRLNYSCKLSGVCSDWNSGYLIWWIKQAAAEQGLTPSLAAAQSYFRGVRLHIDSLCESGQLSCQRRGSGMIAPMELRWTRAFLQELRALATILVFPRLELVPENAQAVTGAKTLINLYQQVTMTSATENPPIAVDDSASLTAGIADVRATLALVDGLVLAVAMMLATGAIVWRWSAYPGVPLSPVYCLCVIFWLYSAVRLLALSYVAVSFGPYEPRIVFSTYTGLSILALLAVWECRVARRLFMEKAS